MVDMKRLLLPIAVVALGCGNDPPPRAPVDVDPDKPEILWEERFDRAAPDTWVSPSRASDEVIAQVYTVTSADGERFLHAEHNARAPAHPPAVHWGREWRDAPIPLSSACSLSWRWRVTEHPNVRENPWADVAVSVYVVMSQPGLFSSGKGFKFGWLKKAGPSGTKQRGLIQIALRTDAASDAWHREQVDLCRLYAQHYGNPDEEKLVYVGVVSDADDTDSIAKGDYDDFVLSTAPLKKDE
jgi:hypothetical protein